MTAPATLPPDSTPAAIDVDRLRAVTITWEDGHVSRFDLPALRLACPCAGCKAEWSAGREPRLAAPLSIVDVRLAGAWGMTPTWVDGHDTGIYSWAYLRAGCECADCAAADCTAVDCPAGD